MAGIPQIIRIELVAVIGTAEHGLEVAAGRNLLADFGHLGKFDVVFCRNVLIYFDQETKIGVFERLARVTETDGYLVLGAAETVVGLTEVFKPLADRRGLYVPNTAPAKAVGGAFAALKVVAAAGPR